MLVEIRKAVKECKTLRIRESSGAERWVEPYAVVTGKAEDLPLHCFQITGESKSGRSSGWKNIRLHNIKDIQ